MAFDAVSLSRLQFAWVIGWDILLPAFTVGVASYIALLEGLHLYTDREVYLRVSKFWIRIFAVAFEHDCRERICGSCGFLINGRPHGGHRGTTVCQLSMRFFKDGDTLTLEPWRARAFPVVRDLMVNRSAFDRIIQAGGFITASTGSAPDVNAVLVPKAVADTAFEAAAYIGCGACAAACPNASAMLFTSAKLTYLNSLPQGQPQRAHRTVKMVAAMKAELFGSCTNQANARPSVPSESITISSTPCSIATSLRPSHENPPTRTALWPMRSRSSY